MRRIAAWICALLFTVSCGDPSPPVSKTGDVGVDGGAEAGGDAQPDAQPEPDAQPDPSPEGDVPLEGFGEISGECGVLDEVDLRGSEPGFVVNHINFAMDPFDDPEDVEELSGGGQQILEDGNAGGSSLLSEVFSFETLHRCELARLLKTETTIVYDDPMGKITDLLVEIDTLKVGVSVTRAVGFPRDAPYTVDDAAPLLERKLNGVLDSSSNVSQEDAWTKQILHIIAYEERHADAMSQAFDLMSDVVKADTIVIVTVSDGDDEFLY